MFRRVQERRCLQMNSVANVELPCLVNTRRLLDSGGRCCFALARRESHKFLGLYPPLPCTHTSNPFTNNDHHASSGRISGAGLHPILPKRLQISSDAYPDATNNAHCSGSLHYRYSNIMVRRVLIVFPSLTDLLFYRHVPYLNWISELITLEKSV